jgi:hypothetical protein
MSNIRIDHHPELLKYDWSMKSIIVNIFYSRLVTNHGNIASIWCWFCFRTMSELVFFVGEGEAVSTVLTILFSLLTHPHTHKCICRFLFWKTSCHYPLVLALGVICTVMFPVLTCRNWCKVVYLRSWSSFSNWQLWMRWAFFLFFAFCFVVVYHSMYSVIAYTIFCLLCAQLLCKLGWHYVWALFVLLVTVHIKFQFSSSTYTRPTHDYNPPYPIEGWFFTMIFWNHQICYVTVCVDHGWIVVSMLQGMVENCHFFIARRWG